LGGGNCFKKIHFTVETLTKSTERKGKKHKEKEIAAESGNLLPKRINYISVWAKT